jgi:hypothetical protein
MTCKFSALSQNIRKTEQNGFGRVNTGYVYITIFEFQKHVRSLLALFFKVSEILKIVKNE